MDTRLDSRYSWQVPANPAMKLYSSTWCLKLEMVSGTTAECWKRFPLQGGPFQDPIFDIKNHSP